MELVFATNNKNKIQEVQALMPKHISIIGLRDIGCFEDIPENKSTIKGNAIDKVSYVVDNYGYDCFADDTGLEVVELNGAPGVYSARYAGEQRSAKDNISKLLKALKGKSNREAQFTTVIALHLHGQLTSFTGICKGDITTGVSGTGGFGYDPIFKAKGYHKTFAEIPLEEKNNIGHRGKAVAQLIDFLNKKTI